MLDEFYDDKTLLASHETLVFSLLTISAKVMVFNVMKSSMKLPLRLTLPVSCDGINSLVLGFVPKGRKEFLGDECCQCDR